MLHPVLCDAVSSTNLRAHASRPPLAAWSDPNPKGMVCIIPSSFIAIWGTLWYQNWPATMPGGGAEVPGAFESDPRIRHRRDIRIYTGT